VTDLTFVYDNVICVSPFAVFNIA